MKDYVIVSADLWEFFERVYHGGPRLPLCTIPYHQVKAIHNSLNYDFVTHMNIETIPNEIAIPTKNVRFMVVVQVDSYNSFVQFHILVPLVLKIK